MASVDSVTTATASALVPAGAVTVAEGRRCMCGHRPFPRTECALTPNYEALELNRKGVGYDGTLS